MDPTRQDVVVSFLASSPLAETEVYAPAISAFNRAFKASISFHPRGYLSSGLSSYFCPTPELTSAPRLPQHDSAIRHFRRRRRPPAVNLGNPEPSLLPHSLYFFVALLPDFSPTCPLPQIDENIFDRRCPPPAAAPTSN